MGEREQGHTKMSSPFQGLNTTEMPKMCGAGYETKMPTYLSPPVRPFLFDLRLA